MIESMPILHAIARRYAGSLRDRNVLLYTHATDATCGFIEALHGLGANVSYIPIGYSAVQAALENMENIPCVKADLGSIQDLVQDADILIEDGARISSSICNLTRRRLKDGLYSMEQTTSGIRSLERMGTMAYPVINIAESRLKLELENSVSTPESVMLSVMESKQLTLARKRVLVLGYGSVGAGISNLCRAHGSYVTVVDRDPIRCMVAEFRGFQSLDTVGMNSVLGRQDIIVSCTANLDGRCLDVEQFMLMKDGALVVNAGSGRGEVSNRMVKPGTFEHNRATICVHSREDDLVCVLSKAGMAKTVEILCSAHPANLRYGEGTAKEAMDFVFSLMALTAVETDPSNLSCMIHPVDLSIERRVANLCVAGPESIRPHVIRPHELLGEQRPWGYLCRFVRNEPGLERFSVARASFKPGSNTDGHYHIESEEAYVAETGAANIITWDPKDPSTTTAFDVKPGDYLVIPRGCAHRVVASAKGFECLIVASPPFSFWDQFFPPETRNRAQCTQQSNPPLI